MPSLFLARVHVISRFQIAETHAAGTVNLGDEHFPPQMLDTIDQRAKEIRSNGVYTRCTWVESHQRLGTTFVASKLFSFNSKFQLRKARLTDPA